MERFDAAISISSQFSALPAASRVWHKSARSLAPITEDGGIGGSVERHLVSYFLAHKGRLPAVGLYDRIIREVEKPLISLTLDATGGNQIRAASVLGLNRNTLRKKIRDLNIDIVKGGRR